MSIDSSLIGKSSQPQTFHVSREAVQRFMEATEDPMLETGRPIEYAPPTFPTTFRMRVPGYNIDTTKMQLLHGEQIYNYTRRIRVDEDVTCVLRIVDVRQREGRTGVMTFVVNELTGTDSEQKHIFTGRSTSIIRMK